MTSSTAVTAAAKRTAALLFPAAVVALVGYLIATRGAAIGAALTAVPAWVVVAAVTTHLFTLVLRTEAWRTVLRAAGGERLTAQDVHSANAGAFLAGTVQGQAAMPTRVALVRRFGGAESPAVAQIALGDVPIVLLEVCASALLAVIGSSAVTILPSWVPWLILGGALAILALFRALHARFGHHGLAAGLAVLADVRLRNRLAMLVAGFTAMAFLRTLIVLAGFDLPSDPAHVCLVLFTMGAVGLLPLGVGTGPAAMVAALGASTPIITATAAGLVVSAATVLSVLIYAGAVLVWRETTRAASRRSFRRATTAGQL